MSATKITSLQRIEQGIDNLIQKHGIEKSADLIEALSLEKNAAIHTFNVNLQKLIIKQVVEKFKINNHLLSTSAAEHYKQARKCCFYLLNKHCSMSSGAIKKIFPKYPKTRNNISAAITQVKELMELPKIDKKFYDTIIYIEEYIIKFKTAN